MSTRLTRLAPGPRQGAFTPLVRSAPQMGRDFRVASPIRLLGAAAHSFYSMLIDMSNVEDQSQGDLGALSLEKEQAARQAIEDAFASDFPDIETTPELVQFIHALASHEGGEGYGWKDHETSQGHQTHMEGSNNWGAIQCKCKPEDGVCCEGCGLWEDSRPTANGQQKYEWCFQRYETPKDGAAAIIRIFVDHMPLVTAVWKTGDLDKIAWAMRESRYYEGFTTDHREAAIQYSGALMKNAQGVSSVLGEDSALFQGGMDNAIAIYNGESPDDATANQGGSSGLATAAKVFFCLLLTAGAVYGGKKLIDRRLAKAG